MCNTRSFNQGLAAVTHPKGWGYINQAGQWAIAPKFPLLAVFPKA
ncbi:WG repeat-containing protein [Microcoleus sp. T2B6]